MKTGSGIDSISCSQMIFSFFLLAVLERATFAFCSLSLARGAEAQIRPHVAETNANKALENERHVKLLMMNSANSI